MPKTSIRVNLVIKTPRAHGSLDFIDAVQTRVCPYKVSSVFLRTRPSHTPCLSLAVSWRVFGDQTRNHQDLQTVQLYHNITPRKLCWCLVVLDSS